MVMSSKLQKYSKYINLPWKQKLRLVEQAQFLPPNSPFTLQRNIFEEENFVNLSVFDQNKTQNMYKLRTYRQNSKSSSPKAVIAIFHGLNSHMNRSGHFAHYLASRNITTVGYDYRGFGKSGGSKGYIESLQTHLSDCEKFLDLVKKIYPETPLFVGGQSLGGLTAYHMSLRHPEWFKGAILLTPAIMPSIQHSNKIHTLIKFLQVLGFLLPNEIKLAKVGLDTLCRNTAALNDIRNDPLYQKDRVKLQTIRTLLEAQVSTPPTFGQYSTPFLVVQGGRDKLIDPNVGFELFMNSKTSEEGKDVLFYEEMWHVIMQEPQISEIQQKVADWILARLIRK